MQFYNCIALLATTSPDSYSFQLFPKIIFMPSQILLYLTPIDFWSLNEKNLDICLF